MNNIVKSVVFAAVVLFAGIATMQVIYKNQDPTSDITGVEPAADEGADVGTEAPVMDTTPVCDVVVPSDAAVEEQKEAIDAEAEAAKEAVEADVEAAKDEAAAVEENADAEKEAIDEAAEEAKDAVEADQEAAEKAAE